MIDHSIILSMSLLHIKKLISLLFYKSKLFGLLCVFLTTSFPAFSHPSFNDIFEGHGSVMLLIDPKSGDIVDANNAAVRFYGYEPEKLRSMRIQDINTLTTEQVKAERQLAVKESRNYFVFRHQLANGEIKTVEVFSNPLDFSGRTLLHSVIVDVTEKLSLQDAILRQQAKLENTIEDQTQVIEKSYQKRTWMLVALLIVASSALIFIAFARRSEQKLHQNLKIEQRRLSNVIAGTRAGTWEWDLSTDELHVNDRWAELAGYKLEELGPVTRSFWLSLIHPEDIEKAVQFYSCNDDTVHHSFAYELRIKHKNGHWVWVLDRGKVHRFSTDGNPLIVSGTRQDISEQKIAEQQLTASHERYLSLTANIPDGTYSVYLNADGNSQFEYVSPRFCEMLQIKAEEVLQDATVAFSKAHPDDLDSLLRANTRSRHEGAAFRWEGRFIVNDEIRWMRIASNPTPSIDRKLVWVGVISDITEAKRTVLSLNLANHVFKDAREGMMITDLDNRIVDVNDAFTNITGYGRDEVIGQDPMLLRSGRHSQDFFNNMWNELQAKNYWTGEFWNRRKSGELYIQRTSISAVFDDCDELREYLCIFSDVTIERSHESELERIAHFDSLTGLPNRILLSDRLNQALIQSNRDQKKVAVLYVDLDKFKEVNDTYGHDVGDELLVQVSKAMEHCLREGDTLARIGGDEFVAVLPDGDYETTYSSVIHRLLDAATAPLKIKDVYIQVTASIGVSLYPQAEKIEADQLMRQADQAMYQAKLRGKNRIHYFDLKRDLAVRGFHASANRLDRAISNKELELYYQPKVDMFNGNVIGMEALLRWNHPVLGVVPPNQFLPSIEKDALIIDIGNWAIKEALQQIHLWNVEGIELNVSVNIAAKQLQSPDFVSRLEGHLEQAKSYTPESLTLEILENTAIDDLDAMSKVIRECISAGVKISLDDFGTGYSSLTYLSKLKVNEIKIDRSFVQGMFADQETLSVLEGIIALANSFKFPLIAEGVESDEHGKKLIELGCRYAQGFAMSEPMPASHVPSWLASWKKPNTWSEPSQ